MGSKEESEFDFNLSSIFNFHELLARAWALAGAEANADSKQKTHPFIVVKVVRKIEAVGSSSGTPSKKVE